jgi:hypothetical protein
MRSQANMTWNKMPHHHIKISFFSPNHGVMDYFSSWHGMKNLHVVNLFIFPLILLKTNFDIICHDIHVQYLAFIQGALMHTFIKV